MGEERLLDAAQNETCEGAARHLHFIPKINASLMQVDKAINNVKHILCGAISAIFSKTSTGVNFSLKNAVLLYSSSYLTLKTYPLFPMTANFVGAMEGAPESKYTLLKL